MLSFRKAFDREITIVAADGIDYNGWRSKAQTLFQDEKEAMSVTGVKTGVRTDESRTFWNTAPPKVCPSASQYYIYFIEIL